MEPQYKTSRPLKIVYIADNFDADNNGTTISVRRFVDALRSFGHTVIVVSNGRPEKDKVVMGSYTKGFVAWYVKRECMVFARPDEKLIREALEGADIAHFQIPFYLECKGLSIARQMDIPCTAGFHCQPENITFNIGMGWCTPLADLIFKIFNCIFYKKIDHIHCPTHFIASELERQHYKAKCHVISNGVDLKKYHPIPVERPESLKDKFIILMSGRLSTEKRQDLLIRAVEKSKYKDRIQIILAGMGPCEKKYIKMSANLPNKPIIRLFSQEELPKALNMSDLYVHAADAEIESISCIEAFACGLVPVIAIAKKSATKQFALSEYNTFKGGNVDDLLSRIEFWIEHEDLRREYSQKYVEFSKQYDVMNCAKMLEEMFYEAIDGYNNNHPKNLEANKSAAEKAQEPVKEPLL